MVRSSGTLRVCDICHVDIGRRWAHTGRRRSGASVTNKGARAIFTDNSASDGVVITSWRDGDVTIQKQFYAISHGEYGGGMMVLRETYGPYGCNGRSVTLAEVDNPLVIAEYVDAVENGQREQAKLDAEIAEMYGDLDKLSTDPWNDDVDPWEDLD
jgi:hypothetical protein